MKKILGLGVLFIGAAVIGKQVYDSFIGSDEENATQLYENAQDELNRRIALGERLTYSSANYAAFASAIYEALKDSRVADDKAQAERILLMMHTTADVMALILAHGRKEYRLFGINDGADKTLPEAISGGEFRSWRLARINKAYKEKGIQFQF